jgi:hypothetical protein
MIAARFAVGLALTLASVGVAVAAPRENGFAAANESFAAEMWQPAIDEYERLVASGVRHQALFYNLGNAYYRAAGTQPDRLGLAVYNYERALRISPGFADARYNLAVARKAVASRVVDRIEGAEGDPLWIRVATRFSIGALTVAFLLFNAAFFGLLLALRFLASGFSRTVARVAWVFVGLSELTCGLLLAGHIAFLERVDLAIVLPDAIELREGPGERHAERGQVHAGLRAHIVAREDAWLRVRLANGHEGWLPDSAVGELE